MDVHQKPLLSPLGAELVLARQRARLTQFALAEQLGISLPTVRQTERGRGSLTSFVAVIGALGMEISGRSLPPGETLGERLASLRRRRGLGRRAVAMMARISATTLAALESGPGGHVATLERVAEVLGAQLRLDPIGHEKDFWSTAASSSVHHGWTTPQSVLDRLYEVVGGPFDLDPCSPARRGVRAPVRAGLRFVAEDDALILPWHGTVFMNPPYGRSLPKWVAKARSEANAAQANVVFGLIPARTDTRWWHEHVAGAADIWLLKGRLSFGDGTAAAPFASAIVVWSATPNHQAKMSAAFPGAWFVPAKAPMENAA